MTMEEMVGKIVLDARTPEEARLVAMLSLILNELNMINRAVTTLAELIKPHAATGESGAS